MITVDAVCKSFNGQCVLSKVSLELCANELVAVIGPSGSGKTTLLRCINNLVTIDSGRISIGQTTISGGVRLTESQATWLRCQVGMVFQSLGLWPYRTALENIIEGPIYIIGMAKRDAIHLARKWAIRMGIEDHLSKYPCQMSRGQSQRVAICRAIVMNPKFLLLDEITSALDPVLAGQIAEILLELKRDGHGILAVTHQIDFVRRSADRVVFMENGSVVEMGSKDILIDPKTEELQRFVNQVRQGW